METTPQNMVNTLGYPSDFAQSKTFCNERPDKHMDEDKKKKFTNQKDRFENPARHKRRKLWSKFSNDNYNRMVRNAAQNVVQIQPNKVHAIQNVPIIMPENALHVEEASNSNKQSSNKLDQQQMNQTDSGQQSDQSNHHSCKLYPLSFDKELFPSDCGISDVGSDHKITKDGINGLAEINPINEPNVDLPTCINDDYNDEYDPYEFLDEIINKCLGLELSAQKDCYCGERDTP